MSPGEIDDSPSPHACARVLTDAFAREPAVSWICGSSATARRHWFTATLDTQTALPAARRYTLAGRDGRPVGAAVLTPPATTPSSIAQARWAARTFTRCGPRALGRTLRYLHTTEAEVPDGAWTLEFIGMAPAAAGRGGGRRLLDRLLADTPATAGVFLTTADPGNVPIYRHFGFDTLRHLTAGPLNITAMHRPATA